MKRLGVLKMRLNRTSDFRSTVPPDNEYGPPPGGNGAKHVEVRRALISHCLHLHHDLLPIPSQEAHLDTTDDTISFEHNGEIDKLERSACHPSTAPGRESQFTN